MSKLSLRFVAIALVLAITGVAVASAANAAKPQGDTRPGWGFGDKNHTHTGPPGQSVRPNTGGGSNGHPLGGPPGQNK